MNPLVSMTLLTYNQERYVRAAVESLLEQDYEPLEIIISDDCSKDGTWRILNETVEEYKKKGLKHKVVLNRNEPNLGVVKNNQLAQSMIHGELSIACAGDDISFPNRVSKIVEAWKRTECKVTIIHHAFIAMDVDGKDIRQMPPRSAECSLGAVAAYATRVFKEFPPLGPKVTIEDQAWAKRALMLGPELQMPDILVRYRVGCGISTKFKNERERLYKNAITMAQSCEQVLVDLEMTKGKIAADRYKLVYEMSKRLFDECEVDWRIVSHLPLRERYQALKEKRRQGRIGTGPVDFYIRGGTYLMPWWLGDFQRKLYYKLAVVVHRIMGGKNDV